MDMIISKLFQNWNGLYISKRRLLQLLPERQLEQER